MKKRCIMMFLVLAIPAVPALTQNKYQHRVAEKYIAVRDAFFSTTPEGAEKGDLTDNRIYGILMDIGKSEAVVTLIVMKDGTVSLWSSAGCGTHGLGRHEKTKKLAGLFLEEAEERMSFGVKTRAGDLPGRGEVVVYFLTTNRIYRFRDTLSNIRLGKSPAASLFALAIQIIAEVKHVDDMAVKSKRAGMVLCVRCNEKYRPELKGDGECVKHGPFSFSMDGLAVPCARCAREKNICQMCGKPLCDILPE